MTIEINGVEHSTEEQIDGVVENLRGYLRSVTADSAVTREASIAFRHLFELYTELGNDSTDALCNAREMVSSALGGRTGAFDDVSLTFTADSDEGR
jgi:hypothetical protein